MRRGFTLIETLVYITLFALIMGGLAISIYGYFETVGRNGTKAMLQEEGQFLVSKINWATSGAKTESIAGTTLTVTKYDNSTAVVALSGNNMTLGGAILNNTNVTISGLTFVQTSPAGITASFTISTKTPTGSTVSQTAQTTNFIRK